MAKGNFICPSLCVYALALLVSVYSLQCNLCIGSNNSDCGRNVTNSMVIQNCLIPPPLPFYRQNRRSYPRHRPYMPPTTTLPTPSENMEELKAENEVDVEMVPTTEGKVYYVPMRRAPPQYDISCVYLTVREDAMATSRTERGCGYIMHNVNICDFLRKHKKSVEKCTSCTTNQCN